MAESSDFRSLKVLDRFRHVIERTGADYDVLRLILRVKFQMDQRRVPTVLAGNYGNKKQKEGNLYLRSLWLYALMGLIMVPFIVWDTGHYMLQMSIVTAMLMFMIMTSMVSDFSSVLLDIRDRNIIMTKPVNARTIGMARAIHAGIYLLLLTGSLSILPLVATLIRYGIGFFLLFAVALILINMLILVTTSLVYLFMMKFLDGEKLKDMINMVQILLSVGIAVGYQLVIRSFSIVDFNMVFTPEWWQLFLPPVWYAALFEWIFGGGGNAWLYIFSALAIVVPIISLMIYVKLMPSFELYLEKMAHAGQTSGRRRGGLDRIVARMFCRTREEQACFRLSANMMRNEREFKLKVYPSIGLSLVLPYIFWFTFMQDSSWAELRESALFYTLYIMLFVVVTVVMMLKYSGHYKAFWTFRAAPLANDHVLYSGTLKAFLCNMFMPVFMINAAIFLWAFGLRILPDIVIILLIGTALIPLTSKLLLRKPPFSESFSMAQQSDGWLVLLALPVLGLFAGIHFYVQSIPAGIWIYIALLVIANAMLWTLLYPVKGVRKVAAH